MKLKKIISAITASSILLVSPANVVFAADQIDKQEIVYISTESDGKLKGLYVVNAFDLEKENQIEDYGKYDNVENLTSLEKIGSTDEKYFVKAEKGKFFYQGDNPKKEIPWNISLEFFLDGKKMSTNEIKGKEGKVTVKGRILKNPKADPLFAKYYLGQFSLSFDSKNAIIKEYKDANLAYKGSVQMLNYTIMPEKELEFEVSLDAKSFNMEAFNFSAIPFNMSFEMPDMNSFTDQLYQLESGIAQLGDGSSQLLAGAMELNSSTKLLYDNLYKIYDGLEQSASGQSKLTDGEGKFNSGLKTYSSGIDQLVSKMSQLTDGMDQLKNGLADLKVGQGQLKDGIAKYQDGLKQYTAGIGKMADGHKQFTAGIGLMATESSQLKTSGSELVNGSSQIYEGLAIFDKLAFVKEITKDDMDKLGVIVDEIVNFWNYVQKQVENLSLQDLVDGLQTSKTSLDTTLQLLETIYASMDQTQIINKLGIQDPNNPDVVKLLDEISKVRESINGIKNEVSRISTLITDLSKNDSNLSKLLEVIQINNKNINEKLLPLKKSLEEYDSQKVYNDLQKLADFRTEYKKFHDGLVQYTDGTRQLVDGISGKLFEGSQAFDKGLGELSVNSGKLIFGLDGLYSGAGAIEDGLGQVVSKLNFGGDLSQISRLQDGIKQLVDNHGLILNGQKDLEAGLTKLSWGLGQYISGFNQYKDGFGQFSAGMSEFTSGTDLMKEQTAGMTDKAKEGIEEAMSAFTKEGFELKSFVDERNTNVNLVQFVYVSDALSLGKEEAPKVEEKEMTFWEKLWDIVSFWD